MQSRVRSAIDNTQRSTIRARSLNPFNNQARSHKQSRDRQPNEIAKPMQQPNAIALHDRRSPVENFRDRVLQPLWKLLGMITK
ncbi:hypothetical protein [Myxacorys almedinensis]|uniref:Uncharacterized protein n=1 Tax=Myxacorys almedinensis A TaxID=2690445 RepID=A0A8J7Z420_9CYAN|nr:hypothetical protein [Myxacorys almedinensis]NDJ20037.1 hypothetical protein [Myxacorys almedinensis A]